MFVSKWVPYVQLTLDILCLSFVSFSCIISAQVCDYRNLNVYSTQLYVLTQYSILCILTCNLRVPDENVWIYTLKRTSWRNGYIWGTSMTDVWRHCAKLFSTNKFIGYIVDIYKNNVDLSLLNVLLNPNTIPGLLSWEISCLGLSAWAYVYSLFQNWWLIN